MISLLISLQNFLAPTLFVLCFYLLLGAVVWWIFQPPRLHLTWPLQLPKLRDRLPTDPVSRQTAQIALPLFAVGILGMLLPLALPLRLLAAQAIVIALLLPWFDYYFRQRQRQAGKEALLTAMRSPIALVAIAALKDAQQQGWFTDGTMRNQDFRQAQWAGADLTLADLRGADLTNANLTGATFRQANMGQVILSSANMATSNFEGATLVQAQLNLISAKNAIFRHADCHRANLEGAKLQRVDFTYANLSDCNLCHTNLKQATLVGVQLVEARYDRLTRWPKHFYPHLSGAKLIDQPEIPLQQIGGT